MKKAVLILFFLVCILFISVPAYANSAEPPTVIILANGLPEDAEITIFIPGEGEIENWHRNYRADKLWECRYRLWFNQYVHTLEGAYIRVTTSEKSFTCPLPEGPEGFRYGHNTLLTLDYENETLIMGQDPWRQPLLTILRVSLTLLTEGLVFFLFGFRKGRSWIVFLVVNLLTQGWLNISMNSYAFSGYWLLGFILMEMGVFMAETLVIPLLVKERKDWQRVTFALCANAVSLVVGILLIGNLPL